MEELRSAARKFQKESDILNLMLAGVDRDTNDIELQIALGQAKRVRREATVVVRELARAREQLQPGGTSDHD